MRSAGNFVVLALALGIASGTPALAKGRQAQEAGASLGPAGDYPVLIGEPFTIDGVTYTPADTLNYDAVGYAVADEGESGAMVSGAHRTLPIPSYVEVTSLESGRTILVRLARRGPMYGPALVALSPAAWAGLGLAPGTSAPVRVRRVNPPEPERALLRTGQAAPPRMDTPPGLLTALKRKLGLAVPVTQAADEPGALATSAKAITPARAKPKGKPATPRTAAPVVAAAPAPDEDAAPSAPAAATAEQRGNQYVQVGAFSSRSNAERAAKSVGGSLVKAGNLWRVRLSAGRSAAEADAALAKARRAGYADARLLHD